MKCCEAQTYEGYDKRSTQQVILECEEEECGVKACQHRQASRQIERLEKREEENDGGEKDDSNVRSGMGVNNGISSSVIIVCVVIVLLAILIPLLTRKG